jgi:hypothetical protein
VVVVRVPRVDVRACAMCRCCAPSKVIFVQALDPSLNSFPKMRIEQKNAHFFIIFCAMKKTVLSSQNSPLPGEKKTREIQQQQQQQKTIRIVS